jgi:hypothetical protein
MKASGRYFVAFDDKKNIFENMFEHLIIVVGQRIGSTLSCQGKKV